MDRRVLIVSLLFTSVLCLYGAQRVNTWNGELEVSNIVISGEDKIHGTLYQPRDTEGSLHGVVLAHGIVNSKEPLSGIALELAKHGYVALSIDLAGHGRSSGSLRNSGTGFGLSQAAQYLADLQYVSDVGLVGHSLGAGASMVTAERDIDETGIVLLGGGVNRGESSYQPSNLLLVIGRFDVLFSMDTLDERLASAFPGNTPTEQLAGNPDDGSLSLLLLPPTTHLFEPVDPTVVQSVVDWFNIVNGISTRFNQSYLLREALIILAFFLLIVAVTVSISIGTTTTGVPVFNQRHGLVYGLVGLVSFLPSMILGNSSPFPSQVFGGAIAWWLAIWGLCIIALMRFWRKESLQIAVSQNDALVALAIFVVSYLFCYGVENVFGFTFRLMVPLMRMLTWRRALSFLVYIPFMAVHFYSEAAWFMESLGNRLGLILSKVGFFAGVVLVQYGGFFVLNSVIIGGYTGFLVEFLVAIVPMLTITGVVSSWGQRNDRVLASVILNSLIFSWISAGLFPY